MTVRVGINGFGRIGRLVLRGLQTKTDLELVHVTEPGGPVETSAHLLEFDTVHGRWDAGIAPGEGSLTVAGHTMRLTGARRSSPECWSTGSECWNSTAFSCRWNWAFLRRR